MYTPRRFRRIQPPEYCNVVIVAPSSFTSSSRRPFLQPKKKALLPRKGKENAFTRFGVCYYNSSFFFVFFFFFAVFTVVGSYRMPPISPSLSLHPKLCVSLARCSSSCVASCKNAFFLNSVSKVHFGGSDW